MALKVKNRLRPRNWNASLHKGRYLGPFARILLAIVNLREKRPEQALAC